MVQANRLRTSLAIIAGLILVTTTTIGASHKSNENQIHHKSLIVCQIQYISAEPGKFDDKGRELKWVGTISGDIQGAINWWFNALPAIAPSLLNDGAGFIGYYSARWEILNAEGELILAGESGGKTVFPMPPPGLDNGVWDGHGIVTESSNDLNKLKGCKIYESGSVVAEAAGVAGNGMFLIIGE